MQFVILFSGRFASLSLPQLRPLPLCLCLTFAEKFEHLLLQLPPSITAVLNPWCGGATLVHVRLEARRINSVILAKAKPCHCLKRGIGSLQGDLTSLRSQHRKKLRRLLLVLLRRHNWAEASGVLSLLHKGTSKEIAISKTRAKFSATLEILRHIKGDSISSKKIQNIYGLWMTKLGPMKNWPMKHRVAVQLEHNLFCLTSKEMDGAYQAALSLMQEHGFEGDPVCNLVVGLTFYELWYSSLPKEMQLDKHNEFGSNVQRDTFKDNMCMSIVDSKGGDAPEGQETNSLVQCDSNTSVRNDKDNMDADADVNQHGEGPMDIDNDPQQKVGPDDCSNSPPSLSTFFVHGLPPCLLPIQLPQLDNLEELYDMHKQLRNDQYNSAVKFLSHAVNSMPPALEAFHPLVQLLLLGDKVKEALDIVEKFSPDSSTVLHLRLKAHLLEHFDGNNHAKLATCFEDILKKDPSCCHSLGWLTNLHRRGDYSTEMLVEMIALNLDAIYAKSNTWRDFASCLLKLSQIEGDRKSWRFRCKWWLTRHFKQSILVSDIASVVEFLFCTSKRVRCTCTNNETHLPSSCFSEGYITAVIRPVVQYGASAVYLQLFEFDRLVMAHRGLGHVGLNYMNRLKKVRRKPCEPHYKAMAFARPLHWMKICKENHYKGLEEPQSLHCGPGSTVCYGPWS
nr:uncharacterized protein LOC109183072 isoform X1 [Ipomoea batatas]